MKQRVLHDLIAEFALKQSGAFDFEKLMKYVLRKDKEFDDEGRLYELACESGWLFEVDRDDSKEFFMPRHCFFKGAEFRVTPLPEEVEGGFLIPGHRFMPFVSHTIFPGAAILKLPDGSTVTMRRESLPGALTIRALTFFGEFGALKYLAHSDKANVESFAPPYDQPVTLAVFEMREFFKQSHFEVGDSLMLTVEDWLTGVCSLRHIPADKRAVDFAGMRNWVDALQSGMERVLGEDDLSYDCNEQAARMFWLAEMDEALPSVISNPPMTLAAFYNQQKALTIRTMGQLSFFWPVDQPVENRLRDLMEEGGAEPETELDAIFQLLGLSVDAEDAEAYMRDALARGEKNPEAVMERVLSGRERIFPNEIIEQDFIDLWRELWDEVRERYVPKKDKQREMRAMFLKLNDRCLQLLRRLDRQMADPDAMFSNPDSMKLGELSAMIHGALVMSNQDNLTAEAFSLPLNELERDISAIIEDLEEGLLKTSPAGVSEGGDGQVYQLKITLKGSQPPIWRRVLVPATLPLERLHDVIQVTFGWMNCHLHQFVSDGIYYQSGSGDADYSDMMECEDSDNLCVCDLLRKQRDTIVYEYDFGDSWEHLVLLEKVLEADPKKRVPICTKGVRAAPPEDCGGVHGYERLLGILAGPDSQLKRDMLEWHGGLIDPEAFDLVAVNLRLREWF